MESGVTVPIEVVPHISNLPDIPDAKEKSRPYTFYAVETWTSRKALWDTILCYCNTFSADDNTLLVVKTSRRDYTKSFLGRFFGKTRRSFQKIIRRHNNPPKTLIITDRLADEEMLKLHHSGDCYFSLTRSEGWGLGAFTAAGLGKPVIITGFGGQLSYLSRDHAFLVDSETVPVIDHAGRKSYSADQNWAEADMAHASHLLRYVYENQDVAQKKGGMLKDRIRERYNPARVAHKMTKALSCMD